MPWLKEAGRLFFQPILLFRGTQPGEGAYSSGMESCTVRPTEHGA